MASINEGTAATRCGRGDVSSEADVQRMFGEVVGHYGALDILINNAGLQRDSRIADMTLAQWNFVIPSRLTGQFLCAREAVRQFRKQGVRPLSTRSARNRVHVQRPRRGHSLGDPRELRLK